MPLGCYRENMRFAWDKKYSVGVKTIDKQHQHFFEITNNIYGLLENRETDEDALRLIIVELSDYALYHFATEERYFNKFGYRRAQTHVRQHNVFRQKIRDFKNKAKAAHDPADLEQLTEKIVEFAVSWMCQHILFVDKQYSTLFIEQGL